MYRKGFSYLAIALAIVVMASASAFAQSAPVTGKIVLEKDGEKVPVEGALVEVFRVGQKAKYPTDKTNKKGEFSFAGLPLGATFVLSVSAPGAKPGYLPGVRAPQEKILITLQPGDGKRWTEEEIRDAISTPATTTGEAKAVEPSADQKKAIAEQEAKIAAIKAKNEQVGKKNELVEAALKDGNAAFNAKNYDLAITKYSEGIDADPDFVGSTPVLLNNRGVTLKLRAVDNYNKAVKITDAAQKAPVMELVKKDINGSIDSFAASWNILKSAPVAEIPDQAKFQQAKYDALAGMAEAFRIATVTKSLDAEKAPKSKEAFNEYLTVETDAAKKIKAQITFADVLQSSGDVEGAVAAYRAVLVSSADNPDALAGLGLNLVSLGYINNDKAQFQEGADYLQKFLAVAPANHPFKDDAQAVLDDLKKTQNVAPVKGGAKKKS